MVKRLEDRGLFVENILLLYYCFTSFAQCYKWKNESKTSQLQPTLAKKRNLWEDRSNAFVTFASPVAQKLELWKFNFYLSSIFFGCSVSLQATANAFGHKSFSGRRVSFLSKRWNKNDFQSLVSGTLQWTQNWFWHSQ